ncbi:MAG: four helix bundle protein [Candidatus Coproplasma sp.]
MKGNVLLEQARVFAKEIESLCKSLSCNLGIDNYIHQLRKSSSSIFANISEAQYPQSAADMLSKFRIALKECIETESWLDMLHDSKYISDEEFKHSRNNCGRIRRLLIASCSTLGKNSN